MGIGSSWLLSAFVPVPRRSGSPNARGSQHAASADARLADDGERLVVRGDWTLPHYQLLQDAIRAVGDAGNTKELDLRQLGELDTAGATLLSRLVGADRLCAEAQTAGLPPERQAFLRLIAPAAAARPSHAMHRGNPLGNALASLGAATLALLRHQRRLLGFIGLALATLIAILPRPWRWRLNALLHQIDHTGLRAVPIVALLTFLVGAVVAFLGATVLADYGAAARTMDLVAYGFMRELGVMLAAILLAGRTASAFTAQIGAMKVNEEIDALRVQGLDPTEMLVLPRMLALVLTLPLLTFVAVLSGLTGGAAVAILALDIPSTQVLGIIRGVPLQEFILGMAKSPVFAVVIALIGCLEGLRVSGSAESVGRHTTASVVQAISAVILLDAVAAMFFMEMGW